MKPIKNFFNKIAFGAILAVTLHAQTKDAPKWINELPMSPGSIYGVGLVNRYYEKKAGEDAADSAARSELAQTLKLNIKTITQSWSGTIGGTGFVQELEKTIDDDVFQSVKNAKILERWVSPEALTYSLAEMSLSGATASIQKKVVEAAKKSADKGDLKKIEKLETSLKGLSDPKSYIRNERPVWIAILPEEEDAIFGVGIAEKFYFYVNGREAAKDKARAELAATVKTQVNAAMTDWFETNEGSSSGGSSTSFTESMSDQVSEATLSGSQIVETWYDKSAKWHYALARMSLSKVISQIQDKAKEKVKDPTKLKGLSDKLASLINRDFLKTKSGIPAWITKMPQIKGSVFAVGIDNGKYFSETQGIEKAKADARTKLAKTVSVNVENVTKSWLEVSEKSGDLSGQPLNDYMSSLSKEATDVSLEGSQILANYIKREKDGKVTFYALGRLFTDGTIAKLKRKAAALIKIPESKSESQAEKVEKAIAGPREKAKAALERLNAALDKTNN